MVSVPFTFMAYDLARSAQWNVEEPITPDAVSSKHIILALCAFFYSLSLSSLFTSSTFAYSRKTKNQRVFSFRASFSSAVSGSTILSNLIYGIRISFNVQRI